MHFVDEENRRFLVAAQDGLKQGPLDQELGAVNDPFDFLLAPLLPFLDLDVKELFRIVPLIKGCRRIQPFIALQADELRVEEPGHHRAHFSFSHARLPFQKKRFPEPMCQKNDRGQGPVGDVEIAVQFLHHLVDGLKMCIHSHGGLSLNLEPLNPEP